MMLLDLHVLELVTELKKTVAVEYTEVIVCLVLIFDEQQWQTNYTNINLLSTAHFLQCYLIVYNLSFLHTVII